MISGRNLLNGRFPHSGLDRNARENRAYRRSPFSNRRSTTTLAPHFVAEHPVRMAPRRRLKKSVVVRALTRLGELCAASGSKVEVAIDGGTVMMFAFDCRGATKDIDAIFHPPEVVEPLIARVAEELDLPPDWMNNGVKSFIGERETLTAFPELAVKGIMITRPSAEYLLAMKCMASRLPTPFRNGDIDDIKFLLAKLAVDTIGKVDAIVSEYYGRRGLEGTKRWLVEKLIEEVRGDSRAKK
jgi:hypothetical protein